uniref:ATP-dependent DNA helicase n=1 Tax=Setaria italica TaxID=4555 RepID=K4A156_SETIT
MVKERRASNLHPDSIAMASPHFTPELVFPPADKSPLRISDDMEIPLVNGMPVYIQSVVEQSPTVVTPQLVPANHTIQSKPVTPGIRNSRLNQRNQMFEATIGRNTKRPAYCDENIIFEDDKEEDEGYLFGGQEPDDWEADEDVDLETANEDPNEPYVLDPYDAVYANVPDMTHMLKPADNCEHCNAKKFESEPPGFCCRSGKIDLSTHETPPELVRLWSSSDSDARHFRANIRYFNGHFSFTSMYCKLDRVTTDVRNCGIYTFRAHGQIYHNIRSFGKEDGHEPGHLELYFYDDDLSLEHRLRKCREKSAQEDRENLRSMGQVDNLEDYHVELNLDQRLDQRTYNVPLTSEVAAVWIEGSEHRGQFDNSVVLQGKDRSIHGIRSYHGCYDALSYSLFFPRGELGWHNCIPKFGVTMAEVNKARAIRKARADGGGDNDAGSAGNKCVSVRDYYCYKFQMRPGIFNPILHGKRLFQQFAIDTYVKIESSRLDYIRNNHDILRADLYQGLVDSWRTGVEDANEVGKRTVLSPTFIGGPRNMRRRYMDAMTLVRKFGKLDIFLTMTCNPNWDEIKNELYPGQSPQDHPDLVSRVFRAKLEELKKMLMEKYILGKVRAFVYVVEFQKRGLPHAHFLLIMQRKYKITCPEQYDLLISAELPNKKKYPDLYRMVMKHMMHGPCGTLNSLCPCTRGCTSCKNRYPRPFCDSTSQGPGADESMLTVYFDYNRLHEEARGILYRDFPEHYTWESNGKFWKPRKNAVYQVGRLVSAHPVEGERYFLRVLLNHVVEATSYRDLRTVVGVLLPSFREAAERRGLIEEDNTLDECLTENSLFHMPSSLRRLFAIILVFCEPNDVFGLWTKHLDAMLEDYRRNNPNPSLVEQMVLIDIRNMLQSMGKDISGIPHEIFEEASIDQDPEDVGLSDSLNEEQRAAYEEIMSKVDTEQGGLFFQASLIIWDEASMAKRQAMEALDNSLRDIMGRQDLPFGGKTVVFGGDFRQVLPVVRKGSRAQIVDASLRRSYLWESMHHLKLMRNMRTQSDPWFAEYLLRIGGGTEEVNGDGDVCLPDDICVPYSGDSEKDFDRLIECIFPNLNANMTNKDYITSRAILSTRNDWVDNINIKMIGMFQGREMVYHSFDSAIDDPHNYYPSEFLNTLTPNGLPPHLLKLKIGCPIILLRNIDPANGLCNGTRLVV